MLSVHLKSHTFELSEISSRTVQQLMGQMRVSRRGDPTLVHIQESKLVSRRMARWENLMWCWGDGNRTNSRVRRVQGRNRAEKTLVLARALSGAGTSREGLRNAQAVMNTRKSNNRGVGVLRVFMTFATGVKNGFPIAISQRSDH